MKKTLIALAVAVSAASGAAHADFKGQFDIDGTITHEASESKWEWAIGSLDAIQKTTKDMTDGNKLLTITQGKEALILSGHTKEAFSVASTGFGAVPVISFSDYKGGAVELKNEGTPAKGYFSLPMKDSENNELGSVKVNVTYAATVINRDGATSRVASVEALNDSHIYYGGLVQPSVQRGAEANGIVARFGGVDANVLRNKIPNAPAQLTNGYRENVNMVKADGSAVASSYILGIDKGQTIEARFDKPVLTTTEWSAPLSVLVTYN